MFDPGWGAAPKTERVDRELTGRRVTVIQCERKGTENSPHPHAPESSPTMTNLTWLGALARGNPGVLAWHVLAVIGAFVWTPTVPLLLLAVGMYMVLMFGITAGYHRYFSHRTFRTSRAGQVVLAWLAQTSLQMGVLWWAAHHREHHRSSDQPDDPHSPLQHGFWYSHIGWVLEEQNAGRDDALIVDLLRFPELRWLDRMYWLPAAVAFVGMGLAAGPAGVVWGFLVPALAAAHVTYTINSLAHTWGWRVYETPDTSRNNLLLALLTLGEGWHNNHHFYPGSARQGFLWWQVDTTWMALRALSAVGLVWDLKAPPARVLAAARRARSGSAGATAGVEGEESSTAAR